MDFFTPATTADLETDCQRIQDILSNIDTLPEDVRTLAVNQLANTMSMIANAYIYAGSLKPPTKTPEIIDEVRIEGRALRLLSEYTTIYTDRVWPRIHSRVISDIKELSEKSGAITDDIVKRAIGRSIAIELGIE